MDYLVISFSPKPWRLVDDIWMFLQFLTFSGDNVSDFMKKWFFDFVNFYDTFEGNCFFVVMLLCFEHMLLFLEQHIFPKSLGPKGPWVQTRSLNYFSRRHFWHVLEREVSTFFSGAIFDMFFVDFDTFLDFWLQVWFLGGQRGLRRVRFLKNCASL